MKNIERKGEIACSEQFLLFAQCFSFYRIDKLSSILTTSGIVVYNLIQICDCPKFIDGQYLSVSILRDWTAPTNYPTAPTIHVRSNEI